MAQTPQTPSGHETLHIGQQLFAALTHNEIAHLLEVLLGTVSPDMVEHVLAQLPRGCRNLRADETCPYQEQSRRAMQRVTQVMASLAGEYEAIYGNMPPFGLGKAGRLVPLAEGRTARERFRAAASGAAD